MKLTPVNIDAIQRALAPGVVIELRAVPGGVHIMPRPQGEMDLSLPCLVCEDEDVELSLTAQKVGDYSIPLGSVKAPAGFRVRGIAGYQPDISTRLAGALNRLILKLPPPEGYDPKDVDEVARHWVAELADADIAVEWDSVCGFRELV